MLFKKNKILNYGPVLAILVCFLCFFSNFAKAATAQNYQIGLPQRDIGIDKVEYLIDGKPQGSTNGVRYKSIEAGSKLNFLIKFNSFYTDSKIGDFKIFSENGVDSFIRLYVYDYDSTGNIITREVSEDSPIDPKQTYLTSSMTVTGPEVFEINFSGQPIKRNITLNLEADKALGEGTLLSNVLDTKYYVINNGTKQEGKIKTGDGGTLILENIPYNSEIEIEASAKFGYSIKNGIINAQDFGADCQTTQSLDNNKMIIKISNFQISDLSKTPSITFRNISQNRICRLTLNGSDSSGTYFDWFEPVEGKENTIKHIDSSPHYVKKGKYVFYVRYKGPSGSSIYKQKLKVITLNGAEIDPTYGPNYSGSSIGFEKYVAPYYSETQEMTISKYSGTFKTTKEYFIDSTSYFYKFEVYLEKDDAELSFKKSNNYTGYYPISDTQEGYKWAINFDDYYTEYAKKPTNDYAKSDRSYIFMGSNNKENNTSQAYEATLELNEEGIKKYGFARPSIYFVPTSELSGLKSAISSGGSLSNYEKYKATYESGYVYRYSENTIIEPRIAVLGPSTEGTIASHFVTFPSYVSGASLDVITEDANKKEIAKKYANGYIVRCSETGQNEKTHENTFTFTVTPNVAANNKYIVKAGEKSCKLYTIKTENAFEDGNFKVTKESNGTYTCTVSNISEDFNVNIEKYTEDLNKEIKFNCPGIKIRDINEVSYNFSGGGSISPSLTDTEYKFKTDLKDDFELAKDVEGKEIPLKVTVNGNEENPLSIDKGFYTIDLINNSSPITVNISGAVFKSEKPNVEIITNEAELRYFHYVTQTNSSGNETQVMVETNTKNQETGNAIISNDDLTPGGSMTFYIGTPLENKLGASLISSETVKLEKFEEISSSDAEWNEIKANFSSATKIYRVTITGVEENCKLTIYNGDEDSVTHFWTLTKSFEIIPNVQKIVDAKFTTTGKTTSDDIIFERNINGENISYDLNATEFDFTLSAADKNAYELTGSNYKCKFYSDKELTKEIDLSSFENGNEILKDNGMDGESFKYRIDIKDKNFEGTAPALSEYISVRGSLDYTKKADYLYEKIYVGIILEPLDSFNIHFSYNTEGDSNIIEYSKNHSADYKGISVTNITVKEDQDEDDSSIKTYKIYSETDFDPSTDSAVNAAEKSFAIEIPEGFLYEDIIASEVKPTSVPTMEQKTTSFSTLFQYPIVSDLGTKDSFRISNVYSKDIYVHVKNLKQRQLKVGFPEQYIEGTDIHLMQTDEEGNTTEKNSNVEAAEAVSYGGDLKIRSRAKAGYKTDEISELIIYVPSGSAYTFIDLSQNITGPSPDKTTDSDWVVNNKYEKLSKIVKEMRYKFTIDKGELVFDIEFKGIKSSFDVQLRRKKKDFTISFPAKNENITVRNLNGDEITGDVSKSYKDSFSFSITPAAGIDITNLVVKDTDENVYNLINGYYTISNIEKDITIKILGIGKETRTLTFTDYDDITYLDSSGKTIGESVNVEYGSSYEFKINFGSSVSKLKDKTENDDDRIQVRLSSASSDDSENNQIQYDYGAHKCIVKNLTENSKITIDGIALNTYTLTFNKPEKTTSGNKDDESTFKYTQAYSDGDLTSDVDAPSNSVCKSVTHGSNFSFRISGGKGVDLSNLKVWLKKYENDKSPTQLVAIDNIYTVENIQGDYIVYTTDSKPTVYTVEIRTTTGVSCLDTNGNTLSAKTEVNHGDTLTFRLSLDKIYDKSTPVVEIKGTTSTLSPGSDGYYRLENIKENKILQITGITKNTYKVTFEETEGVIYKTIKNKPFEKSMDVEYGDTLQFKITLMDAYDSSVPTVLLNNTAEISANAGIYKVEGINSDVAINVKNVKKNAEERAIEEITTVSSDISSSSDVDEIISATNSYNELSDEQKELVTNLDELNAAQKAAGVFNHSADGITVTGIDWYIKLIVTSLNDDEKAIEELNGHLDRKELINLYDIKLYDMLKNEVYKVPYGQEVTVTIPCPGNISEYENIMVVHENSAGGIEYLDVNIKSDKAQFKTTSFSKFGIAGKKIPLDSSKLTNATVSVASLVRNEDELKSLLGENAASEIGELINTDENEDNSGSSSDGSISASTSNGSSESQSKETLKDKAYNWAVKNELPAVIIVLILGFGILALILIPILKKKSNDEEKK